MLKQLAEQLKSQKFARVDVVGHSDNLPIVERSRHIFADNLALSEARARNVVEYLQNQLGVPPEVINLRGLGDSMPTADNSTEAGRALNRRVEISLVTEPVNTTGQQGLARDSDAVQRKEITELNPAESDIVATN
jgi:flagellar motor protein MotB